MEKIKEMYSHQNSVLTILLNHPKGNVLDRIMMNEILEVLGHAGENPGLKCIVFQGAGEHFSYGASVEEHQKSEIAGMLKTFHQIFYTLIDLGIPTMAKISGYCLGGGLELALFCNFLFADETARLGQPEINLGVFPPPASIMLPLKIGQTHADALLLTGRNLLAHEAREWGILNEVYPDPTSLNDNVEKFIEKFIIPRSASSLRFAVKAARMHFNDVVRTMLPRVEKFYVEELMETHDANEGITAFMEKRAPKWKGA